MWKMLYCTTIRNITYFYREKNYKKPNKRIGQQTHTQTNNQREKQAREVNGYRWMNGYGWIENETEKGTRENVR